MDLNATVDLIIRELREAGDIIDDLKNYPGVPALQVELAKLKCKNASEVIELLKSTQEKVPAVKKEINNPEPAGNEVIERRIPETPKYEKSERKTEVRHQVPVNIKEEPRKTTKKASQSIIIADTFNRLSDSLNEQLGSRKDDGNTGDLNKAKPITNLSEAIGVNDKFFFIRELFNGNSKLYNNAISNLDKSQSFADAKAVIMNYAANDTENVAVKQLLELVKRKFRVNE